VIRNGVLLALMTTASAYLHLPEGLFLVAGMLIVLESPLGGGLIDARERALGTLMGLFAVVIASGALHSATQPIQVFCALMLVRLFSFAIGLSSGYVVGGHMVAGGLLDASSHWWHYALWRTIMTIAGVLLGVYFSRTFYTQLATDSWQSSCRSWLSGLAEALAKVAMAPDGQSRFLELREHRNMLRMEFPRLAVEQVHLDGGESKAVMDAQLCIQHGSTILSCTRDLASLLSGPGVESWVWDLPVRQLFHYGSECLQGLADDQKSPESARQIIDIRALMEVDIGNRLCSDVPEPGSETSLLIASRLLLLAGALIEISALAIRPRHGLPSRLRLERLRSVRS